MAEEAKWYVVHTYSGYENKVADKHRKRGGKPASCIDLIP